MAATTTLEHRHHHLQVDDTVNDVLPFIESNSNITNDDNKQRLLTPQYEESKSNLADAFHNVNKPTNSFCQKYGKCCFVILGIFLVILGVQCFFLPQYIRHLLHHGIKNSLIFTFPKPHDDNYQQWAGTSSNGVPIWTEVRLYNVTNPDDVLLYGSMPQLSISGGLYYDEYIVKDNITFSDDGQWASYTIWQYYVYNEEKSQIRPDDYFVIMSPVIGSLWHWYHNAGIIEDEILLALFELVNDDPDLLFWKGPAEHLIFSTLNYNLTINNQTFIFTPGVALLANESSPQEGNPETTHTGYGDPARMGEVLTYDHSEWVHCWDPYMGLGPAHDNFFGLFTLENNRATILAWVNTLYRNIEAGYNTSVHYYHVPLYVYHVVVSPQFENSTTYAPNKQFFQFGPPGILNLSNCISNVQVFVSLPLFLGSEPYSSNNSKMGLGDPTWDDCPYMSVEPKTGVIVVANKSLQMNVPMHSLPIAEIIANLKARIRSKQQTSDPSLNFSSLDTKLHINKSNKSLANIPDGMMVPIVELSECAAFTKDQANSLYNQIYVTEDIAHALEITGYVSLGLLVVYSWYCWYYLGKKNGSTANTV